MSAAGVAALAAVVVAVASGLGRRRRSLVRAVAAAADRLGLVVASIPRPPSWSSAEGEFEGLPVFLAAGRFPERVHPPQVVCRVSLKPAPTFGFRIAKRGSIVSRIRTGNEQLDDIAAVESEDPHGITSLLHHELQTAIEQAFRSTRIVTVIDELAVERRIFHATDVYDATVEAIRIASMLCGSTPRHHFELANVDACRASQHDLQSVTRLDADWASLLRCRWCGRWFVVVAHMKYEWPPFAISNAAAERLRATDEAHRRAAFDALYVMERGELNVDAFERLLLGQEERS